MKRGVAIDRARVLVERADFAGGLFRIQPRQRLPQRAGRRFGRRRRPRDRGQERPRRLDKRRVHLRRDGVGQHRLLHVADDADDFARPVSL